MEVPAAEGETRRSGARGALGVLLLGATTAVSGAFGWFAMWSSHVSSDEGYLITSLREWVERGHLYDAVYSQYGPFYYFAFGLPSRILGLTWTIDAGRVTNLALWMVTTFLFGLAIWKLTERLLFGVAAQILTFSMLNTLVNEPMHPGALLCFLLAALVASVVVLRPRAPRVSDVLTGCLLAALALTKANVGSFAVVAVLFVIVEALPRRLWPWRAVGLAMFVALGPVLLLSDGTEDWKVRLAVLYVVAAIGVALASSLWVKRAPAPTALIVPWLLTGLAATTVVTIGFALVTGTSISGFMNGVVWRPIEFSTVVDVPIVLPDVAWLWVVALVLAGLAARRLVDATRSDAVGITSGIVRVVGGAALIASVLGPAYRPGYVIPNSARLSLLPLVALVLLPTVAAARRGGDTLLARRFLAAAAVTEFLHAYPVPGSQLSWSLMLAALCGVVAVSDGVSEILDVRSVPAGAQRIVAGIAAAGLVVAIPLTIPDGFGEGLHVPGRQFADWVREHQTQLPLDVPGTSRVRRPLAERNAMRHLARTTRESCDTFLELGGRLSYAVLADIRPPSGFNAPVWPVLLTESEQEKTVAALEGRDQVCLLIALGMGQFHDGRVRVTYFTPIERRAIVRYIEREQWEPIDDVSGILVLRRSESP